MCLRSPCYPARLGHKRRMFVSTWPDSSRPCKISIGQHSGEYWAENPVIYGPEDATRHDGPLFEVNVAAPISAMRAAAVARRITSAPYVKIDPQDMRIDSPFHSGGGDISSNKSDQDVASRSDCGTPNVCGCQDSVGLEDHAHEHFRRRCGAIRPTCNWNRHCSATIGPPCGHSLPNSEYDKSLIGDRSRRSSPPIAVHFEDVSSQLRGLTERHFRRTK